MTDAEQSVLNIKAVSRHYRLARRTLWGPAPTLTAVDRVSLTLAPGEALGIVGESGSGKSTLARMVMGFERPDSGTVEFIGESIHSLSHQELNRLRPKFQMVFQDPFSSLDPRRPVGWSVAEPLLHNKALKDGARRRLVIEALGQVGMRADDAEKLPHQFSGGQRQRIAIARAIVTRPRLLVADEPVSALDVSMQGQILNLFMELQEQTGLSLLLISHDLAVIAQLCDRVAVMYQGKLVESGAMVDVLARPQQSYTKSLLNNAH